MNTSLFTSLKSHFLIPMPNMVESSFASTLTIICEHNPEGALGIVVNQPSNLKLRDVFQQTGIDINCTKNVLEHIVYAGGPVAIERGFILNSSEKKWDSYLEICNGIQLTTSQDILHSISKEQGPKYFLLALGYAGWGAGQLEHELSGNAWLNCQADPEILFHTPTHLRLNQAASNIGVNLSLISKQIGHA